MECSKGRDCWRKQEPGDGSLCRRSNFDRLLGRIFPPRTFEAKREVQFRSLVPWEYTLTYSVTAVAHLENHCWLMPLAQGKKSWSEESQLSHPSRLFHPLNGISTFRLRMRRANPIEFREMREMTDFLSDKGVDLSIIVTQLTVVIGRSSVKIILSLSLCVDLSDTS